jgi:hypothetical protein
MHPSDAADGWHSMEAGQEGIQQGQQDFMIRPDAIPQSSTAFNGT